MTITGLKLKGRDSRGIEHQCFKVCFIKNLAYGVINEESTDREFLELFIETDQSNHKGVMNDTC